MLDQESAKEIMTDPQTWLNRWQYTMWEDRASKIRLDTFEYGRMSVTLEVMSQIKYFRALEGTSLIALEREEIITVLEMLLKNMGLWDQTEQLYEELLRFRDAEVERSQPDVA